VAIVLAVLGVLAVTWYLARLEPAAPRVDRDVLLFGTVERGTFVREVRGSGTLVPEQMVFVSAVTGGRVDEVRVQPGAEVQAGAVLLTLSNPDVELEALMARQQLTAARAGLVDLRRNLRLQILSERAAVARSRAEWEEARRQAESDSVLASREFIARNQAQRSRDQAEALRIQLETEEERLGVLEGSMQDQIAVQEEQVGRLESVVEYQERRVASMQVPAPTDGVVQGLALEVGQWVQAGTPLARVAEPGRLKAEIRVPQVQARDVHPGQSVLVDTRTDTVPGRVRRIDPNVEGGQVLVEVFLEGDLPGGARADLSVDGTVEVERLEDVLHVERPAYGQSQSTVSLFRMLEGGGEAVRATVRLGRASVNRIEVLEGLQEGDRIILTDMSRWDGVDRVRIR
jgi:HlyD family secretion protein